MRRSIPRLSFLLLIPVLIPAAAYSQTLTVVGFNVESGGASLPVLSQVVAKLQGVDLWGFSEVQNQQWLNAFKTAAADGEGVQFDGVLGTTGRDDSLAIVYNSTKLEFLRSMELHNINVSGTVRAPLVAHFRLRAQPQVEILFMVNHLYRGSTERRHQQAQLLNQWARQQALPVIAVGDYNFDWNVNGGDTDHDPGFDFMVAGDVFRWLRFPSPMVKTQCSANFNSVLDFVFVAGPAKQWQAEPSILFANDATYCQQSRNSDHRPVMAKLTVAAGASPAVAVTKQDILNRLATLENEVKQLRALVEKLP